MIAVTGANGKLGRLLLKRLLSFLPAEMIVALVRSVDKADDLRAQGIRVRKADYDNPETLTDALWDVQKLLLISAVIPGERLRQHKAVIDAAVQAGVKMTVYTSQLRADSSTLILAEEHKATEDYLKSSGMEFVVLRNGWYTENHTETIPQALAHSVIIGASGEGRFASASRADYADAAFAVLTQPGHSGKTYELAGDDSYSMDEFAKALANISGQHIVYSNLSPTDYEATLLSFGLPKMIVDVVVDAGIKSAEGELDSHSRDLSRLIGRNSTSVTDAIKAML